MQINIGRCAAAFQEVLHVAHTRSIQILMIQEPYTGNTGNIQTSKKCIQKHPLSNKVVKSAIVIIDKTIQVVEDQRNVTENIVGVRVKYNNQVLGLVSLYLEGDGNLDEDLQTIKSVRNNLDCAKILIGGDINAKSKWWGSAEDDKRGSAIQEFCAEEGLHILNEGTEPTFYIWRGDKLFSSIVDVTMCSDRLLPYVQRWTVETDTIPSAPDHRALTMTITDDRRGNETKPTSTTRKYSTKNANWTEFTKKLQENITNSNIEEMTNKIITETDIENLATLYIDIIDKTSNTTLKPVKEHKPKGPGWWTEELTEAKAELKRLRNRIRNANINRRGLVVEQYLKAKINYKEGIEAARTTSWKEFCTKQERESLWDSIYRVLRRTSSRKECLLKDQNGTTQNPQESIKLLANTFFPEKDTHPNSLYHDNILADADNLEHEIRNGEMDADPCTESELKAVLAQTNPKKAPGEDGLTADICRKAIEAKPELYMAIVNACLRLGYFPRIWKQAHIIILPKPGKITYDSPKSYRPIGLLSIAGKIMEKIVAKRILWTLLSKKSLNPNQYGFMPQKSTEDALYDAVAIIRDAVKHKKIVVMISLDIQGAFDGAWWPGIKQQLHKQGVHGSTFALMCSYLKDREISMNYADENISRATCKGCVQGSVCGPLLWNVQMNPLLEEAEHINAHVQAFADDILIIAAAPNTKELEEHASEALKLVEKWAFKSKMSFAASKTQAVIITKKLKYDSPKLYLNGIELEYKKELTVLGLTIDSNMNFRKHLENVHTKCTAIYSALSRAARAQWGLNSEILKTIYVSVIEPIVLYAANIWAPKVKLKFNRKIMDQITRDFALRISRAHRTVSLTAAVALADVIPLHLKATERHELYLVKKGGTHPALSGREVEIRTHPADMPNPRNRTNTLLTYGLIETEEDLNKLDSNRPQIYTDGSKIDGKVGGAYTIWSNGAELKNKTFRLEDAATVFQAELVSIKEAMNTIAKSHHLLNAYILSDSRSALDLLSRSGHDNVLALEIEKYSQIIKHRSGNVELFWIKAHAGLPGNERADELAKQAAKTKKSAPIYDRVPISYVKGHIRQETLKKRLDWYTTATTGATTRMFIPDINKTYQILKDIRLTNPIAQTLTGHGGFRAYLHRFKIKDDPWCTCDEVQQTIEHLLFDCPRFGLIRHDLCQKIDLNISASTMEEIMEDTAKRKAFMIYALHIQRTVAEKNK